jgi:hypothetical protein
MNSQEEIEATYEDYKMEKMALKKQSVGSRLLLKKLLGKENSENF